MRLVPEPVVFSSIRRGERSEEKQIWVQNQSEDAFYRKVRHVEKPEWLDIAEVAPGRSFTIQPHERKRLVVSINPQLRSFPTSRVLDERIRITFEGTDVDVSIPVTVVEVRGDELEIEIKDVVSKGYDMAAEFGGSNKEKVEALIGAVTGLRTDLANEAGKLSGDLGGVRTEITGKVGDLHKGLGDLRTDLAKNVGELGKELTKNVGDLRVALTEQGTKLSFTLKVFGIVSVPVTLFVLGVILSLRGSVSTLEQTVKGLETAVAQLATPLKDAAARLEKASTDIENAVKLAPLPPGREVSVVVALSGENLVPEEGPAFRAKFPMPDDVARESGPHIKTRVIESYLFYVPALSVTAEWGTEVGFFWVRLKTSPEGAALIKKSMTETKKPLLVVEVLLPGRRG